MVHYFLYFYYIDASQQYTNISKGPCKEEAIFGSTSKRMPVKSHSISVMWSERQNLINTKGANNEKDIGTSRHTLRA